MNPQTWWYVARASGFVAWALVSMSVISGLLAHTLVTAGRPRPAWLADLHRFFAGAGVAFTGLHLVGLVADSYIDFGLADVLIPFASSWKPSGVALGVVALYLLAAIEISSLLMKRMPRRWWRAIHLSSYVLFWVATFHLLLVGSDVSNPIARWAANLVMAAVVFLSLVRILSPNGRVPRSPTATATPRPEPSPTPH